jgi:hypothetical protein
MDCIRMPELVFQLLLRCHFSVIVRGCLSLFLLSVAYKNGLPAKFIRLYDCYLFMKSTFNASPFVILRIDYLIRMNS